MTPRYLAGVVVALACAAGAAGQEAGDFPFGGRVLDAGKPVAGALVRLLAVKTSGDGKEYEVDQATRTDAEGHFHLAVPKRWLRLCTTYRQELGIVAVHQGRITGVAIARHSLPLREGLELEMPPAARAEIVVRSPGGMPVRGAVVTVDELLVQQVDPAMTEKEAAADPTPPRKSRNGYVVGRGLIALPPDLVRKSEPADDAGRVSVAGVAPAQVGGFRVDSDGFGTQILLPDIWTGPALPAGWPRTITLRRVGRVHGRLVGEPGAIARRALIVGTSTRVEGNIYYGGHAEIRTDAKGKFEVPELVAGTVRVRLIPDVKVRDCLLVPKKPPHLESGAALELSLEVRPAVRLTGVVLNADTRAPVADVHVLAGTDDDVTTAMTGARGQFAVWVAPGKVRVVPLIPAGFLQPVPPDRWNDAAFRMASMPKQVDAAGAHVEVPPILLQPEATLRGIVVDASGKPVPGAAVSALSYVFDHRRGGPDYRDVTVAADAEGLFTVGGFDPRVPIRLRVKTKAATRVTTIANLGKEPLRILVGADEPFRIRGRVIDGNGQPVAGAVLDLFHRDWRPPPGEAEPNKVPLTEPLRTDAAGKFTTPPLLPDGHYRFVIRAAGVKTVETPWLDATRPDAGKAQELVVTRLGGLAGVVRDRQGKPVADARITLLGGDVRVSTASGAAGEFKLEAPAGKPFCLVVRHPDYRAHGAFYEKTPDRLDQSLARLTEPAEKRIPRTILARAERDQLLQGMLTPYRQMLPKTTSADERMRVVQVLATVDPDFLINYLEKNPLKPAIIQDSALHLVVKEWAAARVDDAEELIGKIRGPFRKAMALCDLADQVAARPKRIELLAEALVAVRAEKAPEFRAVGLGMVGRRLFDLGEKDRAMAVLREGEKLAGGLSTSAFTGYARGTFATDLALIDLPAALALVKDLKDAREFQRHHGNIAHRLAAVQPEAAVHVLDLLRPPKANEFNQRDQYAIRVCYRMAGVDLARALALADSIRDALSRAQAIGGIAQAVARKDPKRATEMLRRAFTQVEEEAARPDPPQLTSPLTAGSAAAVLIFNAEQIDPALVDECLWRAVALHRPPTNDPNLAWRVATTNDAVAIAAARYDGKLAELLLATPGPQVYTREGLLARFLVHPRRTVLEAAKGSSPQEERERSQLIGYVGTPEDRLPRLIQHTLGIWRIDAEDIDF